MKTILILIVIMPFTIFELNLIASESQITVDELISHQKEDLDISNDDLAALTKAAPIISQLKGKSYLDADGQDAYKQYLIAQDLLKSLNQATTLKLSLNLLFYSTGNDYLRQLAVIILLINKDKLDKTTAKQLIDILVSLDKVKPSVVSVGRAWLSTLQLREEVARLLEGVLDIPSKQEVPMTILISDISSSKAWLLETLDVAKKLPQNQDLTSILDAEIQSLDGK